jgi:hypothetical protein
MTNSYIRLSQIRRSDVFTDNLSQGTLDTIESTAVDQEDVFTAEITQLRRIIGGSKWYSGIETTATDARSLTTLSTDVYFKSILRRAQLLVGIAVPASQNYVVLSAAGLETPSQVIAIGANAEGAVVAQLAGAVGSASLTAVAGLNSIFPKNQLLIRDSATLEAVQSSLREVFGLLQVGSTAVDGSAFDDTTNAAQITFVRENAGGTALELVPAADIAGKTIQYTYTSRAKLYELNEQDLLSGTYMDTASVSSISLEQAYKGGGTITVTSSEGPVKFDLSTATTDFEVIGASAASLFKINRDGSNVDTVNFANADVNFASTANIKAHGTATVDGLVTAKAGVSAGNAGPIHINENDNGLISTAVAQFTLSNTNSAGKTVVESLGANGTDIVASGAGTDANITLQSGHDVRAFADNGISLAATAADIVFYDVRENGQGPGFNGLQLTDSVTGSISALPGAPTGGYPSIAAAIKGAMTSTSLNMHIMLVSSNFASGVNMPGSGQWAPALDLSTKSISMNAADISSLNTIFMLNGRIVIGGDASGDLYDIVKGTTPANGDIKFNLPKGIKSGDIVLALSWKA